MENRRPKDNHFILRLKSETVCRKHPRHMQSPGVCSVCLGERLSQLAAGSSGSRPNKASTVSSCSSSFSSSCYSSLEGSPIRHKYRMGSMKHVTMSGFLRCGREDTLKKSKSLAAAERVREETDMKNEKKKGFWSRLLRPRRKKIDEGLVHSSLVTTRIH